MRSYFPYPDLVVVAGVMLATVLTGCGAQTTEHQVGYQTASQRYERPTEEGPQLADDSESEPSGELGSVSVQPDHSPEPESLNHEHVSPEHSPTILETPDRNAESLALQQRIEELENENRRLRGNSADRRSTSAGTSANHEEAPYPSAEEIDELDTATGEYQQLLTDHRKYLDRLLRTYQRKRRMFAKAEASYRVDHMMTGFKFMELLFTGTPKAFNTLPEKDIVAFNEFVEAAEDLSPELEAFLQEYGLDEIDDYEQLVKLNDELEVVLQMDEPTTGNRLLDYFKTLEELGQEANNRQGAYQSGGQQ
ncbi:hypothetical protein [Mariniblastus fucicola]|uniref:Uncharacterized protein n=1 Tax=Mariniblastus fucicola TaxID=980251 RepID=A0A5B9P849_9BACT|nr:hypothetical protein [Mariniblastus fucicola]QEG21040.1 hypothetical protein MFFC18_08920 [Mariniblastus fucicola]